MKAGKSQLTTVGRIGTVYGVHGWVRVMSYTSPQENILEYQPWWLKTRHGVKQVDILDSKFHGKGLIVLLSGIGDREAAKALAQTEVAVDAVDFPSLDAGEYYWHQLEGLKVISDYQGQQSQLGIVKRLLETGANDVLVVQGIQGTDIDNRERLIPYLPEQVIQSVDLEQHVIIVDWDPEF